MTDPLIQAFFEEAAELLADFESGLLALETTPDDAELLNRVFRSAHTLKGNSAMLGFDAVARFTHVLEDLLDQLRKGRRRLTPRVVSTLLAGADASRALVTEARDGGAGADQVATRVLGDLHALLENDTEPAADLTAAPKPIGARTAPDSAPPAPAMDEGRPTLYEIVFHPPDDVLRRGLDPLGILSAVTALGDVLQIVALTDALPALDSLDPETCYLGWRVWLLSDRPRREIEECFDFVGDPESVSVDALPMDDAAPAPILDAPVASSGPAVLPRSPQADAAEATDRSHAGVPENRRAAAAGGMESSTIRVPVEKVDRLINLVGELVITQSMVAQLVSDFRADRLGALQEAVTLMDRHARELHERMMAVRMVPIRTLFARFPRLVRDLAGAVEKQAVLELEGEDTELDKTVIERMADPLTHLVRNAIDHGLEPPDVRVAAGKPREGHVRLEAYQQGGAIYIEVCDDGRGLDRARILAKAIEQGLVTPDATLEDEDVFALILRPGFSTAEKITEVSGRGVGMDVVKRNVEALSGSITIRTRPGHGTTFRVKLPLTLAILDGQSLRVGDETYVVPLTSVVESVRPRREALKRVLAAGEGIMLRGEVVPVLRLHRMFGVPNGVEDATEGLLVIVEHEGARVALLVDELLGQQQVVIKSLEANFEKVDGVAAATILGDGRVALILDVPGLIALGRGQLAPAAY
jgi:two-component system, chemotaxis family, sensor kinase CheA